MTTLIPRLRAFGGIASVRELGATPSQQRSLARAAARYELLRPRPGVYAVPDAHHELLRAATIGGRLTGVSALVHHGLWVPPRSRDERLRGEVLHVEVRVATTVPTPAERRHAARIHWTRERTTPQFGLAPLESVLGRAAAALPLPHAVAVLDSALRRSPLTPLTLLMASTSWRPTARAAAALADERSESGTESVLRVLLRERGIHATPQVPLPLTDLERADLLVGDRLIIECDSEAHHADSASRRADLARDALLVALGFIVLRFDCRQVFSDPAGVVATVAAVVDRGDHLSERSTVRR